MAEEPLTIKEELVRILATVGRLDKLIGLGTPTERIAMDVRLIQNRALKVLELYMEKQNDTP